MKSKRGTYKIMTQHGWDKEEGSYCYCYPFFIHKEKKDRTWKLSHMATGYNVIRHIRTFKEATQAAEALKTFTIFLMPCMDSWIMAKDRMIASRSDEYSRLMKTIEEYKDKRFVRKS